MAMFIGTNLSNIPLQKQVSNSAFELGKNVWNNYIAPEYNAYKNALTGKTEAEFTQNFLDQQMQFNREEAEKNREFQREMSNTAYQRMAQDLEKAGFNRALILGGGGSSTPSGSLASSSLATAPSVTANSTARFNNSVNALTSTFNNLLTNAFDLLKTNMKMFNDKQIALAKVISAQK